MDIVVFSLFWPCLFNLLVKFVSFGLQQFGVRLKMRQGIQPIPGESGVSTPSFPEHSVRSFIPPGQAGVCGPCQAGGSLGEETLGHIPLGIRVQSFLGEPGSLGPETLRGGAATLASGQVSPGSTNTKKL